LTPGSAVFANQERGFRVEPEPQIASQTGVPFVAKGADNHDRAAPQIFKPGTCVDLDFERLSQPCQKSCQIGNGVTIADSDSSFRGGVNLTPVDDAVGTEVDGREVGQVSRHG
jgi:hypothetical protein